MENQESRMICGLFLAAAACQDFRKKEITCRMLLVFGCAAVILRVWQGGVLEAMLGAGIGVILLLAGKATEGAIGYGDGCFFVISGIYLGFWENFCLLSYGVFLCGLACIILFLWGIGKGHNFRRQTVPFLPFLVPVWIWMVWL